MLKRDNGMPKIQVVTDPKTIEKYGGEKMYFAPPTDYDKIMKTIPFGRVVTVVERLGNTLQHIMTLTLPILLRRVFSFQLLLGPATSAEKMKHLFGGH